MKLKSMRVRLPLTYAAIALLTAFALGGVLYITLKDYYTKQERIYLTDRAAAIQGVISKMVEGGAPPDALQAQVSSLAFFTQARVRLLDHKNHVLADSGDPTKGDIFSVLPLTASVNMKGGAVGILQSQYSAAAPADGAKPALGMYQKEITAPISGTVQTNGPNILFLFRSTAIKPNPAASQELTPTIMGPNIAQGQVEALPVASQPPSDTLVMFSAVPRKVAFSSYDLISNGQDSSRPSNQVVAMAIQDAQGNVAGTIELSGGPAFGGAILESVTKATLVAALIAVMLAAVIGWLVSRQVTKPLTALTQVTREMAAGDLSARADVLARDEFGALGEAFNQMAARIEETVGALRKFASDAAHELKTPLTALITDLELIFEDMHTAQLDVSTLERAQSQVQRLNRLMDGLLDLSRLESGQTPSQRQSIDLAHLVRNVSETFAAQAEATNLDFQLKIPTDPVLVSVNEVQMRRVLTNLLENALKFNQPGGSIRLGMAIVADQVEIEITDSGIGIPPEDLAQVFQRFHRAPNAAPYPGSGLGLAIVKAIVDAHDGQIWAKPAVPHGTCFVVRLPLKNLTYVMSLHPQ
jgi:signal transduction histidine kinase